MGWTIYNHNDSKAALESEMKPSEAYSIAWKGGANCIYVNANGKPYHNHFIVKNDGLSVAVKVIGDFRSVAAAKAYLRLAKAYMDKSCDQSVMNDIREAEALIKADSLKSRIKGFSRGEKFYVSENYVVNGEAEFLYWINSKSFAYYINGRTYKGTKDIIDIEKTFGATA